MPIRSSITSVNEPKYGAACTQLLKRVEQGDVPGFTSSHVVADVAHRLMTLEAMQRNGWPQAGIASRLRKLHAEIPHLSIYSQAIANIPLLAISILPITYAEVAAATSLSRQYELLTGDALIVAVVRQQGLTSIASEDRDFDRVPGLTRYAPV